MEDNRFYVYALLDTRKPKGEYYYERDDKKCGPFEYEPFYIGKGCGARIDRHFQKEIKKRNIFRGNIINKIIKETGNDPISIKLYEDLSDSESLRIEINLIKIIGRRDLKTGPLSNLTEGGEGCSGRNHSRETCLKLQESHLGRKLSKDTKEKILKSLCKKKYQITSPNDDIFIETNLQEFCRNHGLNGSAMTKVYLGKYSHHKGWKIILLEDNNPKTISYNGCYKLIDYNNKEYTTNNLINFCKEFDLKNESLIRLFSKNRMASSHMGWKIEKINIDNTDILTHFYDIHLYNYYLYDIDGNQYKTDDLKEFCNLNKLNYINVRQSISRNKMTTNFVGFKIEKKSDSDEYRKILINKIVDMVKSNMRYNKYIFSDINGNSFILNDIELKQYCKDNSFKYYTILDKFTNGKSKITYKDWDITKVKIFINFINKYSEVN